MRLTHELVPPVDFEVDSEPLNSAPGDIPRSPESLAETGLSQEFVAGLVLKALHVRGSALGLDLDDMLAMPIAILDDILKNLQDQQLIEVRETHGPRRGEYMFTLTSAGRARAAEEFEVSRYVGPAPVPFAVFTEWVERQTIENTSVTRAEIEQALEGIVLPEDMLDRIGPAISSGRSLFLYGGPGNGKTLLAERIAQVFGDDYYVPYAVLLDGSVMIVHDPVLHGERAEDECRTETSEDDAVLLEIVRAVTPHDRRFACTRRPVVVTGGELTLEQLDLQWDEGGRMYQAPPQLKAAGGVLLVDDLGRQRVPVRDLLNRWVVPLEQRRDYLKLRSGRKLVVPFDCFVIFSTNLEPHTLADEAFLRRIHYKIEVPGPDRHEYTRIFEACCLERRIPFHQEALDHLFDHIYAESGVEPRRCHPRDVLDHLCDAAAYRDEPACLSPEALEFACRSYFVLPGEAKAMED
jgi:predicted ATPase with chaperone activity